MVPRIRIRPTMVLSVSIYAKIGKNFLDLIPYVNYNKIPKKQLVTVTVTFIGLYASFHGDSLTDCTYSKFSIQFDCFSGWICSIKPEIPNETIVSLLRNIKEKFIYSLFAAIVSFFAGCICNRFCCGGIFYPAWLASTIFPLFLNSSSVHFLLLVHIWLRLSDSLPIIYLYLSCVEKVA